jgi:hypothetical protein
VHPYFDAPGLVEAREIADGHLADCMNMLAFTTGSRFQRHRIRQIVEVRPDARQPVRDPAVASLRRWLRFEPAGDGGGSEERSPRRWS